MQSAHQQVKSLLGQMQASANNPSRLQALSDQMEVLTSAYMLPEPDAVWNGVKLSKLERRVVGCLNSKMGKAVGKTALMNAMYFDKPQEAQTKIIDVKVCHLRKKFVAANCDYEIETIWGEGYRLKAKQEQDKAA